MSSPALAVEEVLRGDVAKVRPDNAVIRISPRQAANFQTVAALPNPPAALMGPLALDGSVPVLLPILDYVRQLLTNPFPREPESTDLRLDIASHRQRLYESIVAVVGILRNVIASMARDLPMSPDDRNNYQRLRTLYFSAFEIGNSLRRTMDAEGIVAFPTTSFSVYTWPRHYIVVTPGTSARHANFGGSSMPYPWRNPYLFTPHLGPHYFERGMGHRDALMETGYWDENDYPDEASIDPPANEEREARNNGIWEEDEDDNNDILEEDVDDDPRQMINENIYLRDSEDP
ncbi:uncharacterized protein LOC111079908 [Drosophila obscura]|uniref:uncharacterized protein LOC111079908 n=1 Tax=Drosophila obscura TaxID=7282 RepID=UPI001BB1C603|nr:uncharacterized protein LOC111079908 [Drosophila obscura]